MLPFCFLTGADYSWGNIDLISIKMHDVKDFFYHTKHRGENKTASVGGELVNTHIIGDMDLKMLGKVNESNINKGVRSTE